MHETIFRVEAARACLGSLIPPAVGALRPGVPRSAPRRLEREPDEAWLSRAWKALDDHEAAQERTRIRLLAVENRLEPLRVEWGTRRDASLATLNTEIEAAPVQALGGTEEHPGPLARAARAIGDLVRRVALGTLEAFLRARTAARRIRGALRAAGRVADLAIVKLGDPDHIPPRSRQSEKLRLRAEWYERRADGFGTMKHDVERCGQEVRWIRCHEQACRALWCVPAYCDESLACPDCRQRSIAAERARTIEELGRAERALSDRAFRRRFLVLPVLHQGALERRIELAQRARPIWTAAIGRYLRALGYERHAYLEPADGIGDTEIVPGWWWVARLETTEGDDHEGHFHWNVLTVAPWIPHALSCVLWARAQERCGVTVPTRSLLEVLDDLGRPRRSAASPEARRAREIHRAQAWNDPAVKAIGTECRIPWLVPGEKPPRRRGEERVEAYVARRVDWAEERGGVEKRIGWIARKLPALLPVLADWRRLHQLAEQLGEHARVPWAVTWISLSRGNGKSAVEELVKYAIKDWTEDGTPVEPSFVARVIVESKRRRLRWSASSLPASERPEEKGDGCPACGSPKLGPEPERAPARTRSESWQIVEDALGWGGASARGPP